MKIKKIFDFLSTALILLLVVSVSSLPLSQSRHLHTMMRRRTYPEFKPPIHKKDPPLLGNKHLTLEEELVILDKSESPELPQIFVDDPSLFDQVLEEDISSELREQLSDHGITRIVIDEDDNQGRIHVKEIVLEHNTEVNQLRIDDDEDGEVKIEEINDNKKKTKFSHPKKGRRKHFSKEEKEKKKEKERKDKEMKDQKEKEKKDEESEEMTTDESTTLSSSSLDDVVTDTSPQFHKFTRGKKTPFMLLPVTTEGKSALSRDDVVKVYGIPKELLPIMPGGGSRFEDVEREKIEKKKMSQTKGHDEDSAENGGSHEAESLYSSASLSSLSIVFCWFVSFLHLGTLRL